MLTTDEWSCHWLTGGTGIRLEALGDRERGMINYIWFKLYKRWNGVVYVLYFSLCRLPRSDISIFSSCWTQTNMLLAPMFTWGSGSLQVQKSLLVPGGGLSELTGTQLVNLRVIIRASAGFTYVNLRCFRNLVHCPFWFGFSPQRELKSTKSSLHVRMISSTHWLNLSLRREQESKHRKILIWIG